MLTPYLDITALGKPKEVIAKRVHSKAYHDEEVRGLALGFSKRKAQSLSIEFLSLACSDDATPHHQGAPARD